MVTFSTCCWVRKLGSSLTYEYPWQRPGRGLNQARCHSEPALSLLVPVSCLDLTRQLPRELAGCLFVWSVIPRRPFSSGDGEDMTPFGHVQPAGLRQAAVPLRASFPSAGKPS